HYVPSGAKPATPDSLHMLRVLTDNAGRHGIELYGPQDRRQGIVHVIGPELALTLPGLLVVCGDSHTSTHGALGALAFGIGASQVAHVLATQTILVQRPKRMRITVTGRLGLGVGAKDLALAWIQRLGSAGAQGHAIEYVGQTIRALSTEGRLTLCNMSIEGGARFGLISPDEVTFDYLRGRAAAPTGPAWDQAVEAWTALGSDPNAVFDREVSLSAEDVAPIVTWGTSPDQAAPITATVPNPDTAPSHQRAAMTDALSYMDLTPGRPLDGTPIDRVFIGSCTNGRIEDLRMAAAVLAGRRARVPGLVSPGSMRIREQAEDEGLAQIFTDAGLQWGTPGCSMCVGMNGDSLAPKERCASSTNRNFRGRQGRGARTHLASPAMVAAAAIAGALTDVRPMLTGRAL
ncbi:MAG: 3-isopropylmalate dehydratase large subunit, partial [Pseudomonadota bacterium]